MVVRSGSHLAHAAQITPYLLLERPGTLAVQDAHLRHPHHQGIVDEILHPFERLGGTHTPHVDVVLEIEAARRDIHTDHRTCPLRPHLPLILRIGDGLQPVERHRSQ